MGGNHGLHGFRGWEMGWACKSGTIEAEVPLAHGPRPPRQIIWPSRAVLDPSVNYLASRAWRWIPPQITLPLAHDARLLRQLFSLSRTPRARPQIIWPLAWRARPACQLRGSDSTFANPIRKRPAPIAPDSHHAPARPRSDCTGGRVNGHIRRKSFQPPEQKFCLPTKRELATLTRNVSLPTAVPTSAPTLAASRTHPPAQPQPTSGIGGIIPFNSR